MSLKRVHTGYENNVTYHDRIVIISDPIAAPGAVVPFRKRSLPFFIESVSIQKNENSNERSNPDLEPGPFISLSLFLPLHYHLDP